MSANKNDEITLVDFHLEQLDEPEAKLVRKRLEEDAEFRQLSQDLANTFAAVDLLPEREAPSDLVAKTMARIRQAKQANAAVAREEMARPLVRPTFSLREGIIVAASVLVIASIFVPSLQEAKRVSRVGQCGANVGQIGTGLQEYASANAGMLPAANGKSPRWLPGGPQSESNSRALFHLVQGKFVPQMAFQCPAAESSQPFQVAGEMQDFPGARSVHYSYQHSIGSQRISREDPKLMAVAKDMVILADATPFYRDGTFRPEQPDTAVSDNHGRTGQNVLYLDMHVGWVNRPNAGVDRNNIYLAEGIYNYNGDESPAGPTDTFLLPAYCGDN